MNDILKYAIAGLLGIIFHVLVVKIPSIKAKSKVANHAFSFRQYLIDDWYTLAASLVSVGIIIITLQEILGLKPMLARYVTLFFVFVGFTGSSLIQSILSVANRKIMEVIDIKTNIADGIIPPVTPENLDGAKEIVKDETGIVKDQIKSSLK